MAAHNGLLAPLAMFIIAGAYYFLSAQRIINEDFMDHSVRQMVGLMYLSDVGFNLSPPTWHPSPRARRRHPRSPPDSLAPPAWS